jgi:hypothetical protein
MTVVWGHTFTKSQTSVIQGNRVSSRKYKRATYVAATCGNCGAINVAEITGPAADVSSSSRVTDGVRALSDTANKVEWYPTSVSAPAFPDAPDQVARCAIEAYQAASIGANIAAILMARTTIEATAKHHGITKGRLIKKIDDMAAAELIRPALKRAAHAIRILGNDMAHGDVDELPSSEDVEDTLKLMTMILAEVFEAAALTDAILERRRKASPRTPDDGVEVVEES